MIGITTEQIVLNNLKHLGFENINKRTVYDIQTDKYAIEVKSCRFINNAGNRRERGRFHIQLDMHGEFKQSADRIGILPIYWFIVRIKDEMIQTWLPWDEVDLILKQTKKYKLHWEEIFMKGRSIKELRVVKHATS
jgi:hypothetical protein